jgi:2-hydroxychromene-2-carboxylate isomerase
MHLDVYFDYRSPFAYVAAEVLPRFAELRGLALHWRPTDIMLLSNYENGLPYSDVKRRYTVIDAIRTAEYHRVKIRTPKPHPVVSERALRLAAVTIEDERFSELHRALFRAAWRDRRDLSSEDVLRHCIEDAGGSPDEWLARADSDDAARQLESIAHEAENAGVFGVPTMRLEGELFWGLDSLPVLEWRHEQRGH